ncbi:MAG TPA: haloacid dehalogenase type II, partial [Rhodoblastus sp.]|nr:haloacid dehalogenase type II [Rhodoblastus sp.]
MRIRLLAGILFGLAIGVAMASPARAAIKAVAFDYFVLFDANSLVPAAEAAFPGKGAELVKAWRGKLFDYNFLTSIADRRQNFEQLLDASLDYAAEQLKLDLPAEKKR